MKSLLFLFSFGIGSIVSANAQPVSATIYYADGSLQKCHNVRYIWGFYYDNSCTSIVDQYSRRAKHGQMRVEYNNSKRWIPMKDIKSIELIDYAIQYDLRDVKLKYIMKNNIEFENELKVISFIYVEIKDELSSELTEAKIEYVKQNKDKKVLNIKKIVFD